MNWDSYLASGDAVGLAKELDAYDHSQQVAAACNLTPRSFRRLFEITKGARPLRLTDLVPDTVPALTPVHHIGINSLPMFRTFEKTMYRGDDGVISGRNVQTWSWATGPGYFSARANGDEVQLDYTSLPSATPTGWPAITSNRRGLSYFVFRDLIDDLRPVSAHITIGLATRLGKSLGQYFLLVRRP